MAFSVQQKCPATLNEAVSLMLEMKEYMLPLTQMGSLLLFFLLPDGQDSTISSIRQEEEQEEGTTISTVDPTMKLITLLEQLVIHVENVEQDRRSPVDHATRPVSMNRKQHLSRTPPQQSSDRRCTFSEVYWQCQEPWHMACN